MASPKTKRVKSKLKVAKRPARHAKKPIKTRYVAKRKLLKLYRHLPKTGLLIVILFIIVIVTTRVMIWTVKETDITNQQIIKSADSMLAYNAQDIKTAGIVGTVAQLKNEIVNFDQAPSDLQIYMLNDYKSYKKACVVGGSLAGEVSYELVKVEYNQYALIKMGCNGVQQKILKKFDHKWTIIYNSNVVVPCNLVNDFNIPQAISYKCSNNGVVFVNPNP